MILSIHYTGFSYYTLWGPPPSKSDKTFILVFIFQPFGRVLISDINKSLESREILTSLAPSRSKKLNFHSLSLLHFQDFEEKILFLFSIYENLKHKSRSLLDLDLEFSSGPVCVWN